MGVRWESDFDGDLIWLPYEGMGSRMEPAETDGAVASSTQAVGDDCPRGGVLELDGGTGLRPHISMRSRSPPVTEARGAFAVKFSMLRHLLLL